jgi:UPF0755 protein
MNNKIKIGLGALALLAVLAFVFLGSFFKSNTKQKEKAFLFVKTGSDYNALMQSIKESDLIEDLASFEKVASRLNLNKNVKPGRYEIKPGMSNYKMVRMLRSGNQKPVQLVLKKYRTQKDLASHIGKKLECDSATVMALLNNNEYLKSRNLDSLTSLAAFTPNTYEFYWNTTAEKVFEKIEKQYNKFWNEERKAKASAINMNPAQVMTLASIVEEETNVQSDKGNVASVYLNRLKKGMPLQADPTLKYAVGDFAIKRVLNIHKENNSPYNTYKNVGLPPGPICTPSLSTIDAVLNAPKTDYIFFCASPDKIGYSNFAVTLAEHEANAKKYQEWLNKRKIMK